MKKTKQQQLELDWRAHNKRQPSKKLHMTFDEYVAWVSGKSKRVKRKDSAREPVVAKPSWANTTDHIASVVSNSKTEFGQNSMVQRVVCGKITGEEADLIIRKANRIGIAYSKGAYQYISEETDVKTLGKKSQQL